MNFENFGKKVTAKIYETLESGKAERMMTHRQQIASNQREELGKRLESSGFGGDILKATATSVGGIDATIYKFELEISQNRHEIKCSFLQKFSYDNDYYTDMVVIIDGQELSEDAAKLYIESHLGLFIDAAYESRAAKDAQYSYQDEIESENWYKKQQQEEAEKAAKKIAERKKREQDDRARKEQSQREIDEALK